MQLTISIISALCAFFIGVFVVKGYLKDHTRMLFAIFCFAIGLWAIANYLSLQNFEKQIVLFWMRFVMVLAIVQSVSFFIFVHTFPKHKIFLKKKFFIGLLIVGTVAIIISLSPLLFKDVVIEDSQRTPEVQPGMLIFLVTAVGSLLSGFILLIKRFRKSTGIQRVQYRYIFYGSSIMFVMILVFNFIAVVVFDTSAFVNFGPFFVLPFIFFTAYAIIKHRLMDIRLIVLRTITYSLVVLLISATVVGLTLLIPQAFEFDTTSRTITAIAVSIFIVIILDPLKKAIGRATDKLFFKARVDYQKLLAELSEVINREIDLDVLLFSLSRKIEKRLKVKNISLYVAGIAGGAFYKRKGRLDKQGKKISEEEFEKNNSASEQDLENKLAHTNPLVGYLRKEREVIVLEALERKIEDTQDEKERKEFERSKQALDKLEAGVVAPILLGDHLNAVMVMGPKLSGDPYGSEDLELLNLIGPQLASALEKSRLYDEARQFTERLKKEVAIATEGLRNSNLQLQERNRFLSALQNVTNLITKTLDFKKVTQAITDSISTELGYLGGILLFLGKNKHKVFADAVTRGKMTEDVLKMLPKPIEEYYGDFQKDTTRSIKAIKMGKVQIGTDLAEFVSPPVPPEISKKIQKKLGIKAVIAVPIYSELGIVGVIDFLLAKDPGTLKDTDLSIMKALANQTGIIYRNIELYRQLQESNKELAEANKHLQALDQAKSEFVSITSHQLRTPMTGIMGYLSMILQGDFGKVAKEQKKVMEDLLEESQRMIRLINLFLNVSKIESGKLELSKRPVEMGEVITKVMTMVKKAADDKKLKIKYIKPSKPLPRIMADKDKLGDVVLNLVDNAIKYTDKGGIIISTTRQGNFVQLTVKDTGRGIPPTEAKKLFTKFVRGFGIAQVHPDGSGLGLYVARRLAEGHGGKIWVESKGKGKGSTFHVTIPIAKDKE